MANNPCSTTEDAGDRINTQKNPPCMETTDEKLICSSTKNASRHTTHRAEPRNKKVYLSTSPLVSVIVPVFNTEPYLEQALSSIEQQSLQDIEIICLNDGSTDNSLAIMNKHAAYDARIQVLNKTNEGYGATCNRGLDMARGRYVAIVEPDDWIEPDMFSSMIAFRETFPGPIDIIKTPYWRIVEPDSPQQKKLHCSYHHRIHPPKQPFKIADAAHLLEHHPSIWSALYEQGFLKRHNIRFREFPGAGWADNPFLLETLLQAENIIYLDKPFYCYREETEDRARSAHQKNPLLPLERWIDMQEILDTLHVNDPRILRAHISRGFTYLNGIANYVGLDTPQVKETACQMFSQMDEQIVMSDPKISPANKALYRQWRGLAPQQISPLPYYKSLVSEGLYSLRNTGVKNTFSTLVSFLSR